MSLFDRTGATHYSRNSDRLKQPAFGAECERPYVSPLSGGAGKLSQPACSGLVGESRIVDQLLPVDTTIGKRLAHGRNKFVVRITCDRLHDDVGVIAR